MDIERKKISEIFATNRNGQQESEWTEIQTKFFLPPFSFGWRTGTKNPGHSGKNEMELTTMESTHGLPN